MIKWFYLFIVYSFLGWLMEVILVSFRNKKFTDRGFLIGPCCPIYGFGALAITLLLRKYYDDPLILFVMSFIVGSFLEYITSYIMEKLFKARWWDYTDHKFNVNGRISLETSLGFGALGVILIYFLNPFFMKLASNIPTLIFNIVSGLIFIIFIVDTVISFKVTTNIKQIGKNFVNKDATEEIKKMLKNKSFFTKRLLKAFPHFKFIGFKK